MKKSHDSCRAYEGLHPGQKLRLYSIHNFVATKIIFYFASPEEI